MIAGCTPKDHGEDFPERFAGLNRELVATQAKVDRRLPALRSEIHAPSRRLRFELREYEGRTRNVAERLVAYDKPAELEDDANLLAGYLRDEEQVFDQLRRVNREHNRRAANAAIGQLAEAARGVGTVRPRVVDQARREARS